MMADTPKEAELDIQETEPGFETMSMGLAKNLMAEPEEETTSYFGPWDLDRIKQITGKEIRDVTLDELRELRSNPIDFPNKEALEKAAYPLGGDDRFDWYWDPIYWDTDRMKQLTAKGLKNLNVPELKELRTGLMVKEESESRLTESLVLPSAMFWGNIFARSNRNFPWNPPKDLGVDSIFSQVDDAILESVKGKPVNWASQEHSRIIQDQIQGGIDDLFDVEMEGVMKRGEELMVRQLPTDAELALKDFTRVQAEVLATNFDDPEAVEKLKAKMADFEATDLRRFFGTVFQSLGADPFDKSSRLSDAEVQSIVNEDPDAFERARDIFHDLDEGVDELLKHLEDPLSHEEYESRKAMEKAVEDAKPKRRPYPTSEEIAERLQKRGKDLKKWQEGHDERMRQMDLDRAEARRSRRINSFEKQAEKLIKKTEAPAMKTGWDLTSAFMDTEEYKQWKKKYNALQGVSLSDPRLTELWQEKEQLEKQFRQKQIHERITQKETVRAEVDEVRKLISNPDLTLEEAEVLKRKLSSLGMDIFGSDNSLEEMRKAYVNVDEQLKLVEERRYDRDIVSRMKEKYADEIKAIKSSGELDKLIEQFNSDLDTTREELSNAKDPDKKEALKQKLAKIKESLVNMKTYMSTEVKDFVSPKKNKEVFRALRADLNTSKVGKTGGILGFVYSLIGLARGISEGDITLSGGNLGKALTEGWQGPWFREFMTGLGKTMLGGDEAVKNMTVGNLLYYVTAVVSPREQLRILAEIPQSIHDVLIEPLIWAAEKMAGSAEKMPVYDTPPATPLNAVKGQSTPMGTGQASRWE